MSRKKEAWSNNFYVYDFNPGISSYDFVYLYGFVYYI